MKPTIAISLGDPNGIGAEITKKALRDPSIQKFARFKIYGERKFQKNLSQKKCGEISFLALEKATHAVINGECAALVTAPVSKTNLQAAGFKFPGQTEYLTSLFKTKNSAMMLCSPKLRVVLVTIHVPLKKVFSLLTPDKIFEKIVLTHLSLKNDFGIKNPRLGICGLNPHAGEGGMFGVEEKGIIIPAIKKARTKKINVSDPLPPDTIFYMAVNGKFDAVICHYHDQGLIPLKTLSFDEGVNTTLGLPIIRTSPDHGPAFDIAGKGMANASSMKAAIRLAVMMWKNRK